MDATRHYLGSKGPFAGNNGGLDVELFGQYCEFNNDLPPEVCTAVGGPVGWGCGGVVEGKTGAADQLCAVDQMVSNLPTLSICPLIKFCLIVLNSVNHSARPGRTYFPETIIHLTWPKSKEGA